MHSLFALAAPLALMLPWAAGEDAPAHKAASAPQCEAAAQSQAPQVNPLSAMRVQLIARQVRIEQRVVVRIAPASTAVRQNMLAELPQRAVSPRFEEAGKEKCVALEGIAGVQTGSGNRLVLFLRDRRMISVNLEKSCRARDFYSGFYVERRKDGRLCVDRDELQSRTGARCEVESMRRLVEVRE
jgi:pyruvate/2-oxoglutarate dehydrogenase complex dihydrolipoamide acyltransferase (E2) component